MGEAAATDPQGVRSTDHPLLSVVIPMYAAEAFVVETVRSVLESDDPNLEVIAVDDGSPDRCAELVADLPVQLLRQENRGVDAARRAGLDAAHGTFVVFHDADDIVHPGGYRSSRAMLEADDDLDMVIGRARIVDGDGEILSIQGPRTDPVDYASLLLGHAPVPPGVAMFRTETLRRLDVLRTSLRVAGDYALYLQVTRGGRGTSHDDLVLDYVIHGESLGDQRALALCEVLELIDECRDETDDPDTLGAMRDGERFWVRYLGKSVAAEAVRSLRRGEVRRSAVAGWTLLRHSPKALRRPVTG